MASWDRLLAVVRYPAAGSFAIVGEDLAAPGGTTANSAVALARLGAAVTLAARIGDDAEGVRLRAALEAAGVDTRWLSTAPGARTDAATVIVSAEPPDRTIFWHQGAQLRRGDRLDVTAIFDHDLVLLDVADAPLRRFLVDLPAHTAPRARLLGPLTYLLDAGIADAFDVALRHDAAVGNEREWLALVGAANLDGAIGAAQTALRRANLRAAFISRGAAGCIAFTADERWDIPAFPVRVVDPTGAGDAFAAGIAYGLARRWALPRVARFANAVGALATRALGSQAALPTLPQVASLLGEDPATLEP